MVVGFFPLFLFTERVYIEMGDNLGKGKSPFFLSLFLFSFFISRERREGREGCEVTWKGE